MLSVMYSGTSSELVAGGWQMREIDSIGFCATEDHPSVGGVGLRQGLYDTDRRQSNLHSGLSIDWHYEARPRLYSTVDDDDSMWEFEAVQALQLGPRKEPSALTVRTPTDRNLVDTTIDLLLALNSACTRTLPNQFCLSYRRIWNAGERPLATTNLTKFVVTLKEGVQPYGQHPRTEPPHKRERISVAVPKALEAEIYKPSESPWVAPVVLVSRPGNGADDRLCADYRERNNGTVVPR
ncbi:hypothetical protein Efla_007728 [Eimeria flavescens]